MAPVALNNGSSNGSAANGNHSAAPTVHATSERRAPDLVKVTSPNLTYTDESLVAKYTYHDTVVDVTPQGKYEARPVDKEFEFVTDRKVPKTGLMLVGWGGNNGSTLTATILANKHNINWHTNRGVHEPNYIGSLVRASTVRLGTDSKTGKDVFVPFCDMLPMVHPNDLVLGGWDISAHTLDKAMERGQVLDYDLQRQVAPLMADMKPLPSIYYPTFINANQGERANNVLPGQDKQAHLDQVRSDIREFKQANGLDKVIVLWTANTERYSDVQAGVHDTAENVLQAVRDSHAEISPSSIFAIASILEGCPFINGAPQNTFVPGIIKLAEQKKAFIGGDDFKSGQTKVKSVLAEYLTNAGIKMRSISSYNHLGNNDGHNLSAPETFRSKEISKSSVVDDMVHSNPLLFKRLPASAKGGAKTIDQYGREVTTEHPDHIVVIKYVPAVGDSKRAIDEYYSEIFMNGTNTLSIFNECQDSLLATPLIIDLALIAELLTRVTYSSDETDNKPETLYSVLGLLSYMLKAPLTKPGEDVINSLARQRGALDVFLRACLSLQPQTDLINFTYAN